nr:NADH dehydrogenase subunit 4L [Boccardiella hamata]
MHLESLLLLTAILALVAAAKQRSHILMAILSLEATSLVLAAMYSVSFSSYGEDFLGIILLTLAAAETASALGLLSTLSRFSGSDNISTCSFSSASNI